MIQASFAFHRDHSRMSKRHQEPALVFRELKPKCCFVLTRFQVFEVQGTEFWKPQAALGFGSSHTDSEEQCLDTQTATTQGPSYTAPFSRQVGTRRGRTSSCDLHGQN